VQRLIEQPSDDGDLLEEDAHVGRVHYHLAVYHHFSDDADQTVPSHVEVEGRLTGLDDLQVEQLQGLPLEWTLRLADGRTLDFAFVNEEGAIHSTGRGLHTPG
jgi:hypothetical protein